MRSHPPPLPQQRLIALPCKNAAVLFISLSSSSSFLPRLRYIQSDFSVFSNPFVRPLNHVFFFAASEHHELGNRFMQRNRLPVLVNVIYFTALFFPFQQQISLNFFLVDYRDFVINVYICYWFI